MANVVSSKYSVFIHSAYTTHRTCDFITCNLGRETESAVWIEHTNFIIPYFYTVLYTVQYTVLYTVLYTVQYTVLYTVLAVTYCILKMIY